MKVKITVSAAFALHALLGSFCMMPMAMAADMPMHHNENTEVVMTSMGPMSSVNCDHCVHLEKEHPAPLDGGCAGHCLSKANDVGVAVVQNPAPISMVAVMPPSSISVTHEDSVQIFVESNAPPPRTNPARTIVLLQ